jgi:two-component system, NtrC family, response regulator AtoC
MARERVLIVDDEKLIRWSARERLQEEGYLTLEAESGAEALDVLKGEEPDLLVLDYRLPDMTGLQVLEQAKQVAPEVSVVMMTAYGTVESAVQAMKLGAYDYLTKPVNLDELAVVVQKALESTRLKREVRRLHSEKRETEGPERLIGDSPAMREIQELIGKIVTSQASTVLIEGESGTGKNMVAKAIHYSSPRAEKPFVTITCSALTETLLESELFGHERGAFTDAKVQKKGLLEVADGGTAFLDEIGEIGRGLQSKLLRFLEDKTFKRVGGTRDIQVDVRVVAATNRNLEDAVREGRFRSDLYYRLKVIPVTLPPLRERREDIPVLVRHFLDHYSREFRKSMREVSADAMERLAAYDWPGNVRELRNVIERIVILENKETIEAADLPAGIRLGRGQDGGFAASQAVAFGAGAGFPQGAGAVPGGAAFGSAAPPAVGFVLPAPPPPPRTLEEMERHAIHDALERTRYNQVRAAKILGISRDTLRYRMKKFGLMDAAREE